MEAEELIVAPINVEALTNHILKLIPLKDKQEYIIENSAFLLNGEKIINVVTDNECCYEILEKKMHNGTIQYVYEIGCRIKTWKDGGYSFPMTVDFWFSISLDEIAKFLKPAESLKDFMIGRYEYNPRISSNTQNFIKFAVSNLK